MNDKYFMKFYFLYPNWLFVFSMGCIDCSYVHKELQKNMHPQCLTLICIKSDLWKLKVLLKNAQLLPLAQNFQSWCCMLLLSTFCTEIIICIMDVSVSIYFWQANIYWRHTWHEASCVDDVALTSLKEHCKF